MRGPAECQLPTPGGVHEPAAARAVVVDADSAVIYCQQSAARAQRAAPHAATAAALASQGDRRCHQVGETVITYDKPALRGTVITL